MTTFVVDRDFKFSEEQKKELDRLSKIYCEFPGYREDKKEKENDEEDKPTK